MGLGLGLRLGFGFGFGFEFGFGFGFEFGLGFGFGFGLEAADAARGEQVIHEDEEALVSDLTIAEEEGHCLALDAAPG